MNSGEGSLPQYYTSITKIPGCKWNSINSRRLQIGAILCSTCGVQSSSTRKTSMFIHITNTQQDAKLGWFP